MSKVEVSQATSSEALVSSHPVTAGSLLRAAREASGLHIAALSVAMKVPVKKLEALEADRADLLPDIVFVRALASSVCRTLKVDPTPVLDLLPHTVKASLESTHKGINAPFKAPGDVSHLGWLDMVKRPPVIIVIALLVAAVVVVFMPEIHWPETTSTSETTQIVATTPARETPTEPASVDKVEEKLPPVEVVPAPLPAEAAKMPAVEVSTAIAAPATRSTDMVLIRAKGVTWVEVADATGAVLVRRTLPVDGVTSANGVAPLAVVIGKADVAEVEVRGKPLSLSNVSKDNVARFEVK
jgi:cytoskeleton protein RodZ